MIHLSIWASGNGSNAENLIRHFQNHPSIRVDHVLTNNREAGVIQRAQNLGVHCQLFSRAAFREGTEVATFIAQRNSNFIILAGFLQLVPTNIIEAFPQAIINIHPALLPDFGGKGMYGHHVHDAVIAAGCKESGITIHLVDEVYDHGKTLTQKTCPIDPADTADVLAAKIHLLEQQWFPKTVEAFILQGK